jgi:hypothetical protein
MHLINFNFLKGFLLFLILQIHVGLFANSSLQRIADSSSVLYNLLYLRATDKVEIINPSGEEICFYFNLNNRVFQDMEDVLKHIDGMADEYPNEEKVRKAWRFVRDHVKYNIPVSHNNWIHDPLLILNSIGFGQCSDLSSVLAYIWKYMGYEVRVWVIENHVMPEVKFNGSWELYDPSYGVYYKDENGRIAGFEEISENPSLVYDPYEHLPVMPFKNLADLSYKIIRYTDDLAYRYQNGGELYTVWNLPEIMDDMQICLPPGSKFILPVNSPSPVIIENMKGLKRQLTHYARYSIPKGWNGKFSSPFLVTSVSGKGVINLEGGKDINLDQFNIQFNLDSRESPPNSINVISAESDLQVYCLINPNIVSPCDKNFIELKGKNVHELELAIISGEKIYATLANNAMDDMCSVSTLGLFERYERQKNELRAIMFTPKRPIKHPEEILLNLKAYFSLWDGDGPDESEERIASLNAKFIGLFNHLGDPAIEAAVLKYLSEPVAFIKFIYMFEEFEEFDIFENM